MLVGPYISDFWTTITHIITCRPCKSRKVKWYVSYTPKDPMIDADTATPAEKKNLPAPTASDKAKSATTASG